MNRVNRRQVISITFLLSIIISPCLSAEGAPEIRLYISHKPIIEPSKQYKYQLVDLLLKKTQAEFGDYKLSGVVLSASQRRIALEVNAGVLDAIITMTSKIREEELTAIRYPVFKGLYGYRVMLIRGGDQERFSAITTVDELKKLTAIQGRYWPDTKILDANGFAIETAINYEGMFDMLVHKRVDYYPRALHEPWKELQQRPDKNLAVEASISLQYPAPGYIFVAKDNNKLAERLRRGFELIISSGEFDVFFNNHPQIKKMKRNAKLHTRRIFKIPNPLLSKETPLEREELWYTID